MPGTLDSLLSSLAPGGKDFERVCQWLLQNAPEYRSKLKRVWLWDEWPDAGARRGIDLVAETSTGSLWAVQAKHYDPGLRDQEGRPRLVPLGVVAAQFTYRLLIATTDHLGADGAAGRSTVRRSRSGRCSARSSTRWTSQWPTSLERLRPAKPKRKKPRPHQRRRDHETVVDGLARRIAASW